MAIGTAAAILGASVIGGGAAIFGASKASKAQKSAAKKGTETQLQMFEIARGDLNPFRKTGKQALFSLADMYGIQRPGSEGGQAFSESSLEAFRNSPDYQVASREAITALDRSAAARGNLLSGGHTRRVMEVGADIGSRYFGSYLDRLANLAGLGQSSAAGTAAGALQTGQGVAQSQLQAGEASAAGTVGATNAVNQSLGNAATNYAFYNMMQPGSAYSGSLPVGAFANPNYNPGGYMV
ncbi:MAG: hypothetical protein U1A72_16720 [Sulfuritalea sp.]|nr:hypothetical protein [Sulfuritalea sp.]